MRIILLLTFFMASAAAAKTDISEIPDGYKLVKQSADCKDAEPCAKEHNEIDHLKKENARLNQRVKLLEDVNSDLKNQKPEIKTVVAECPKVEPKTIIKELEKIKEIPVEKIVEVPKPYMKKNVVRILGAVGQDGLESDAIENQAYVREAHTFYSTLAGAGYTRFFDNSFGLGLWGLFGVTNKTVGLSAEYSFD